MSACSKWATRTQATHRHKNLEGPTVFFGGPSASCCTAACFSHVPENWWKDVKGQTASPHLWYLSGKMLKRMAQTIVFLLKQGKKITYENWQIHRCHKTIQSQLVPSCIAEGDREYGVGSGLSLCTFLSRCTKNYLVHAKPWDNSSICPNPNAPNTTVLNKNTTLIFKCALLTIKLRIETGQSDALLTIWASLRQRPLFHVWHVQHKGPRKSSMMESKASEECWFLSKSSCQEQRLASLLQQFHKASKKEFKMSQTITSRAPLLRLCWRLRAQTRSYIAVTQLAQDFEIPRTNVT